MPAKIAISSNEFQNDAARAFEVAREFGIAYLEVWQEGPWDAAAIRAAGPQWQAAGVRVACISSWSQLNKVPEAQEQVLSTIETAGALGCPFVNTYYGINEQLSDEPFPAIQCRNDLPHGFRNLYRLWVKPGSH